MPRQIWFQGEFATQIFGFVSGEVRRIPPSCDKTKRGLVSQDGDAQSPSTLATQDHDLSHQVACLLCHTEDMSAVSHS